MSIDSLINQISENDGMYALHKDIPEDERKIANKLISYGLIIETRPHSYRITKDGYRVCEIGFDKWNELKNNPIQPIVENYTNSNVIKNSTIQDSDLHFDSSANKVKNAPAAHPNQNEDSKIIDIIKKYWWFIIIPVIVGIILLKIEYGWFNNR